MKASGRYHLRRATECDREYRTNDALTCLTLPIGASHSTPNEYDLVRQQQGREAQRNVKTGPFEMLGGKGCLFLLFGRRRGRRPRNGRLKVRLAGKRLRAELRQELGLSISPARAHNSAPHTEHNLTDRLF